MRNLLNQNYVETSEQIQKAIESLQNVMNNYFLSEKFKSLNLNIGKALKTLSESTALNNIGKISLPIVNQNFLEGNGILSKSNQFNFVPFTGIDKSISETYPTTQHYETRDHIKFKIEISDDILQSLYDNNLLK